MNLLGSENFYRINRDLYRAAQPGRLGMLVYEGFGIRSVINLRALHSDKDEMGNTRLNLIEIPMHAWDAGNDQYVIKVLQAIRDARKPVLLHCRHGADRTGLMIAMYRIVEEGWDKNDAIRELREGGYGFHSIWRNIPSYIEQVDVNALRKALR